MKNEYKKGAAMAMMFAAMAIASENPIRRHEREKQVQPIKPKKLQPGQKLFFVENSRVIEMEGYTEYYEDGTKWIKARTMEAARTKAKNRKLIN